MGDGDRWYIQSECVGAIRSGMMQVQEKAWPGRTMRMNRMEAAMIDAMMMKRRELGPLD